MTAVGTGPPRIARPALARRLAAGLDAGSVLLVAGAGYGKTMAVEEAIGVGNRRAAWVACAEAGGEAGRLLTGAVRELRAAVPGLADVVGERLTAGMEPVDVSAATAALLAELEHLLVEPLVIVFDDAEELEGSGGALAMIDQLLNARAERVAIAIASRRALPLKLAKLRGSGRLVEVGPDELCFTAIECEELLRARRGREVTEDEVGLVVAASEGWPMGVALTSLAGSIEPAAGAGRDDLFHYLAEEVFDHLDPALRLALVDSSVPGTLTPGLVQALGLPAGFLADAERSGLFLRAHPSGARSYHPLFRSFLLGHLDELRSEQERAALHARTAAYLGADGDPEAAIEHWLSARAYAEALGAIAEHAPSFLRSSPDTLAAWLRRLPAELHDDPAYQLLDALLLWGAGRHEQALGPLRAAVAGSSATGDATREWRARSFLADAVISNGEFDDLEALADGWESVRGGEASVAAAGVAWYRVIGLCGAGRIEEAEALAQQLRAHPAAEHLAALEGIARVSYEPAAGRARETRERLLATIEQLERSDPLGGLPYTLAMLVLVLRDLGERGAALEWLDRCEAESERAGLDFVARDCMLQRAYLLALDGDRSRAELELARAGPQRGAGWRGVHRHEAEAQVAALRGDARAAVAAAQRALERVAPGTICFRVWVAVDMAPVLADNGAPDVARQAVENALATLDAHFPGATGRLHRARLLAARACLQYDAGEAAAARASLRGCWEQAGDEADQIVRVHWPRLRPVLWHALAERTLTPDAVLPAIQAAFPGGETLVALVDHPDAAVRRAALTTALATGHPAAISRLSQLAKDGDEQVASAASATRERLRADPPPLRFELFGGFRVRRGGWALDEGAWQRPMASRIVRFLLIQGEGGVPEDALFEAFWADRDAETARQHLAVALSRARKVLDLPGAEQSVIETRERTYRLRLRERDTVDTVEFETAAVAALTARGRERQPMLARAAGLWTAEPLPEDRFSAWTFAWRERLGEAYSQVLSALIEGYEAAGDHHGATRAAQRLLDMDPLNEAAHRHLMAAYARAGRTSYALRQYLTCRRALVVELGVEPSTETSALQARILAGGSV